MQDFDESDTVEEVCPPTNPIVGTKRNWSSNEESQEQASESLRKREKKAVSKIAAEAAGNNKFVGHFNGNFISNPIFPIKSILSAAAAQAVLTHSKSASFDRFLSLLKPELRHS